MVPSKPDLIKAAKTLARTASVHAASRRSGIPIDTIRKLQRSDMEFIGYILEFRTKKMMKTSIALEDAGPLAVQILVDEMKATGDANPRKIRAAKVILQLLPQMRQTTELLIRIRDMEERLQEQHTYLPPPEFIDVETLPSLPPIGEADGDGSSPQFDEAAPGDPGHPGEVPG